MKFLISADWHLGYQPNHSPIRAQDFLSAGNFLTEEVCKNKDLAGLIILGDIRDTPLIYPEHFDSLLGYITKIERAKKQFGVIMGNHDLTAPSWVAALASSFACVSDLSTPEGVKKMGLNPQAVFGSHYTNRVHLAENLKKAPAHATTLLLHQSFEETITQAPYFDLNAQSLRQILPDQQQLTVYTGDIHNPSDTQDPFSSTRILSPGSLQMTDINELSFGEHSQKFYVIANGDTLTEPEYKPLPPTITRPWAYLQITDENTLDQLKDQLKTLATEWQHRPAGIVRIRTLPDLYFPTQLILSESPELKEPFLECHLQVKTRTQVKQPQSDSVQLPEIRNNRHEWLRSQIELVAATDTKLRPKSRALIQALCRSQNQNKKEIRQTLQNWKLSNAKAHPSNEPALTTETSSKHSTTLFTEETTLSLGEPLFQTEEK